jgi:hypothetical protein
MANMKPTTITTGEVRISYEHLLKPYANQPGQEEKFSATLLIPKRDTQTKQRIDAAIQAAIQEGIAGRWNGAKPAQIPIPIYDGDGVRPSGDAYGAECKGHWVMTASSKMKQDIVDLNMNPIIDSTEVYSGIYAHVNINFFAYNSAGKKGIGCGLGPVQKTRDGEPLGGRVTAADAFGGQAYNPGVQPPQGAYQQAPPQYPQQPYAAPAAPQPYAVPTTPYPQQAPSAAVDPITGRPIGNVMGL